MHLQCHFLLLCLLIIQAHTANPFFTNQVSFENSWPPSLPTFGYKLIATSNVFTVQLISEKISKGSKIIVQGTLSGNKILKKKIVFEATMSQDTPTVIENIVNVTVGKGYTLKFTVNSFRWRSIKFGKIVFNVHNGARVKCPKRTLQKGQGLACCPITCVGYNSTCNGQPSALQPGTCISTYSPSPSVPVPAPPAPPAPSGSLSPSGSNNCGMECSINSTHSTGICAHNVDGDITCKCLFPWTSSNATQRKICSTCSCQHGICTWFNKRYLWYCQCDAGWVLEKEVCVKKQPQILPVSMHLLLTLISIAILALFVLSIVLYVIRKNGTAWTRHRIRSGTQASTVSLVRTTTTVTGTTASCNYLESLLTSHSHSHRTFDTSGSEGSQFAPLLEENENENRGYQIDAAELVLGKKLAGGGFGIVRQAIFQGVTVAAKEAYCLIDVKADYQQKVRSSIMREAKMLMSCHHPNIVQFFGVCIKEKYSIYLVMELANKGSMSDAIRKISEKYNKQRGPMKSSVSLYRPKYFLDWALNVASAMTYLHSRGILHRDLKPDNILIFSGNPPVAKLCDFGISKAGLDEIILEENDNNNNNSCNTNTNESTLNVGTLNYMAPELVSPQRNITSNDGDDEENQRNKEEGEGEEEIVTYRNYGEYGVGVDVWSYGILLIALFTLRHPLSQTLGRKISNWLECVRLPDPDEECPEIILEIIRNCLVVQVDRRPMFAELCKLLRDAERQDGNTWVHVSHVDNNQQSSEKSNK